MANPQKENGFTNIANEIMEALCKINLSSYQTRIMLCVLRKTYGWNKKSDWISNSQLNEITGIQKQHVSRALNELKKRNIIIRDGHYTSFQKDYELWTELPKQVITDSGSKFTNSGFGVTSTGEHKRNYTKETIQKNIYSDIFDFWNELGIVVHKDIFLTEYASSIKKAVKLYELEDIYSALCNYCEILKSDKYYFSYKWNLKDFLKRGLEKFLDEVDPKNNFLKQELKAESNSDGTGTCPGCGGTNITLIPGKGVCKFCLDS